MATPDLRNTPFVAPQAGQAPAQLRDVVRLFGRQRVIDELNLDIAPGEFVALLGARAPARPPCCALWPGWTRSTAVSSVCRSRVRRFFKSRA